MFRLIQTHAPGGDACAPYDVKFDKPYTIEELVKEVLTKRSNEWGRFDLRHKGDGYFDRFATFNYRYGKLVDEIPEEIGNLNILEASSYGGWSGMDYNIIIK